MLIAGAGYFEDDLEQRSGSMTVSCVLSDARPCDLLRDVKEMKSLVETLAGEKVVCELPSLDHHKSSLTGPFDHRVCSLRERCMFVHDRPSSYCCRKV